MPTGPATGADLIAQERHRQVAKGYTAEHDRGHGPEDLINAALAYASPIGLHELYPWGDFPGSPLSWSVQNLTKAGALIAAAIDVLNAEES